MLVKIIAALVGLFIIIITLGSAIRSFVVPRAINEPITRMVFKIMAKIFSVFIIPTKTYEEKDAVLAYYAPLSLLALPLIWLTSLTIGFSGLYYAAGATHWSEAFTLSGSSLLTLGFAKADHPFPLLEFTQAALGPLIIALLISYLPTMYAAFHERELTVNRLTVRAGSPPSPVEMISRFHRLGQFEQLGNLFVDWEDWFVSLEQSHTALSALVFFRSSIPGDSWVNAAGCIMDTAALRLALLEFPGDAEGTLFDEVNRLPADARAAICIRAGFIALRRIADFFNVAYNPDPRFPEDPISITRGEFYETVRVFTEAGVPIKKNVEQAWQDYAGWRVNYDSVLNALKTLTHAAPSQWLEMPETPTATRRMIYKDEG